MRCRCSSVAHTHEDGNTECDTDGRVVAVATDTTSNRSHIRGRGCHHHHRQLVRHDESSPHGAQHTPRVVSNTRIGEVQVFIDREGGTPGWHSSARNSRGIHRLCMVGKGKEIEKRRECGAHCSRWCPEFESRDDGRGFWWDASKGSGGWPCKKRRSTRFERDTGCGGSEGRCVEHIMQRRSRVWGVCLSDKERNVATIVHGDAQPRWTRKRPRGGGRERNRLLG